MQPQQTKHNKTVFKFYDRKYKDYVYRKMLVQEYLEKIKNI